MQNDQMITINNTIVKTVFKLLNYHQQHRLFHLFE